MVFIFPLQIPPEGKLRGTGRSDTEEEDSIEANDRYSLIPA